GAAVDRLVGVVEGAVVLRGGEDRGTLEGSGVGDGELVRHVAAGGDAGDVVGADGVRGQRAGGLCGRGRCGDGDGLRGEGDGQPSQGTASAGEGNAGHGITFD